MARPDNPLQGSGWRLRVAQWLLIGSMVLVAVAVAAHHGLLNEFAAFQMLEALR